MKRRVLRVLAVLTGCILAFGCGMAVYAQESIPEEEAVNIVPFAAEPESFCDEPAALSDEPVLPAVSYQTHVQSYGWMDWDSDGDMAGTTGEAKRMEAVQIRLTDGLSNAFDVYYRVHVQNYGWLGWAKNGEKAGTEGRSLRMEAMEIQVVPKGTEGFSSGTPAFIEKETVSSGNQNGINDPNGIYGNGTGGIYIDIHSAPYTTFASYAYGQYAYSSEGCAWFAASRVHELTGVGTTIWSGRNWWNGGQ